MRVPRTADRAGRAGGAGRRRLLVQQGQEGPGREAAAGRAPADPQHPGGSVSAAGDPEDRKRADRPSEEPIPGSGRCYRRRNGRWTRTPREASSTRWPRLTSGRLVEEKAADLGQFGLAAPALEVIIERKDGKTQKLLIGDDSPAGGGSFAKLDGDPRIFTIAVVQQDQPRQDTPGPARQTPADVRRREADAGGVDRQGADHRIRQERPERMADHPAAAAEGRRRRGRGAHPQADRRQDGSRLATEEDDKKAASAFAGASLVGVARVTDAAGTQQLEVRRGQGEELLRAQRASWKEFTKSPATWARALETRAGDFRNKKLFDFGFSDPVWWKSATAPSRPSTRSSPTSGCRGPRRWTLPRSTPLWTSCGNWRPSNSSQRFHDPGIRGHGDLERRQESEKVLISKQGTSASPGARASRRSTRLTPKALEDIQKAFSEIKPYQPPKTEPRRSDGGGRLGFGDLHVFACRQRRSRS